MPEQRARQAFVRACHLDVQARKPGNVSLASAGHRMQAQQFLASAQAAAAPLCALGAPVGARVEAAMQATWGAVGCNTNLGIVLLCAPLACAQEGWAPRQGLPGLRDALQATLAALTLDDARAAYRAIARTQPAGLGSAPEQDVHREPEVTLLAAMQLAAARDRIAGQYASGFADVLGPSLEAFHAALHQGPPRAMQRCFLELLARYPDSHIARKHGDSAAHSVMAQAQPWAQRASRGEDVEADPAFAAWDDALKAAGLNPGTTADLCVATAMVAALLDPMSFDGPGAAH